MDLAERRLTYFDSYHVRACHSLLRVRVRDQEGARWWTRRSPTPSHPEGLRSV